MALTVAEARRIAWIFIRAYPSASNLAYKFRYNTSELYEHRSSEVPVTMKGGYIPRRTEHNGRIYDGRVDVPLGNITNSADLFVTLRHEVLGHYGLNTFHPEEKQSLLDGLIAAREEPSLKSLWRDVNHRYSNDDLQIRAEEVFALHCEGIQPSHHINSFQTVHRGQQSFQETCIDCTRLMQIDDLHHITCMVAQGLHDRTRMQQIFPQLDEPLKREDELMSTKKLYHQQVAEKIIESIENGTAAFVKPWKPGEFMAPHNPASDKAYRGINMLNLSCEERGDPRWCTYKQAEAAGWQVKKGEKGTAIEYWKFEDRVKALDENKQVKKDEQGKDIYKTVKLVRPRVFYATVFNAEQMDGVPALEKPEITWDTNARAETMLQSSGATIKHDQADRAFYRSSTDQIHLPDRSSFDKAEGYYEVAMHELGHWTGHSSRLDRELSNPFGSEGYAKEELRAEIASFMLNSEIGLGRDPSAHAGYVQSWVKVLKEDPQEIFRASSDASKIKDFVLGLEQEQELNQATTQNKAEALTVSQANDPQNGLAKKLATENTPLYIPYEEKEAAKQAAGKLDNGANAIGWDKENRSWYAKPGCDLNAVKQWANDPLAQASSLLPQEEFSRFLAEQGLIVDGQAVMDGKLQRVKVDGDKGSERSGAYTGFLDGHPAGFAENFRAGTKVNWSSKGYHLSKQDRAREIEASKKRKADKAADIKASQLAVAKRCRQEWEQYQPALYNAYCDNKGVDGHGAKEDTEKRLVVPYYNSKGEITTFQRISANGFKQFEKGGEKSGSHHLVDGASGTVRELRTLSQAFDSNTVFLAEGFATGKTVSQATGLPTYVCGDSGNLVAVAKELSKRSEGKTFIVAGDDDRGKKNNVGREKATEAARVLNGTAMFPIFSDKASKGTDFNDLMKEDGMQTVQRQIKSTMNMVKSNRVSKEIKPALEGKRSLSKAKQSKPLKRR